MKLQNETKLGSVHGRWYGDACLAAFGMELLGERWTALIVRELMMGPLRFSDIRARLPGISAKVLTERLDRMESVGVLERRTLAPPAAAKVYELTRWGYGIEPVFQALGRWAVRSPHFDHTLPLSPTSFMLSLRTMIDPEAAPGLRCMVRFEVGGDVFSAQLDAGSLAIRRAGEGEPAADLVFRAPTANDLLPVFYGKQPLGSPGLAMTMEGPPALAERFIALFSLNRD